MSEQPALEFGRAFDAYQSFVLATKLYWTRELYPALKRKVTKRARACGCYPVTVVIQKIAVISNSDTAPRCANLVLPVHLRVLSIRT